MCLCLCLCDSLQRNQHLSFVYVKSLRRRRKTICTSEKICQKFLTLYVVRVKESNTNTNGPPPTPSALNPNIASVILHTVQYMLSSVLVTAICIIIKKCFTCISCFLTTVIFDWAELPRGEIKRSPMLGVLTRLNRSLFKPNPLLWDERWYRELKYGNSTINVNRK